MEEEIKKKRGRPRKSPDDATKAPYHRPKEVKPKGPRGGARVGAGRKVGWRGQYKENPKIAMLPFRVSEITARRIKLLREMTKDDEMSFVDMLERWVEEYARDYGIE